VHMLLCAVSPNSGQNELSESVCAPLLCHSIYDHIAFFENFFLCVFFLRDVDESDLIFFDSIRFNQHIVLRRTPSNERPTSYVLLGVPPHPFYQ